MKVTAQNLIRAAGLSAVITGAIFAAILPIRPPEVLASVNTSSFVLITSLMTVGHLGHQWTDWFEGLAITQEENGDTLLTGPVVDQAALHGLLKKVRDLGMPLLSVDRVLPGPGYGQHPDAAEIKS